MIWIVCEKLKKTQILSVSDERIPRIFKSSRDLVEKDLKPNSISIA